MAATQGGNTSNGELDDYFGVLGETHRDAVVGILVNEDRSVQLSILAEWVAAETRGVSLNALTDREIERTQVELHHNHLPKLDEAGVVDYAYEEDRIAPAAGLETADRLRKSIRGF